MSAVCKYSSSSLPFLLPARLPSLGVPASILIGGLGPSFAPAGPPSTAGGQPLPLAGLPPRRPGLVRTWRNAATQVYFDRDSN